MKKNYCVVLTLMLISFVLSAQKKADVLITLENGISFPVGQFAAAKPEVQSINPHQNAIGYAKTGFQVNLSGSYFFHKNFAAVLNAGFSINDQQERSIAEFHLGNQINSYEFKTKADAWKLWRFLAGISYNQALQCNEKYFIQAKALAGISKTKSPGYDFVAVSNNQSQPSAMQVTFSGFKLDPAFGWQANAGIGYWFRRNLFAMIDLNYFDSEPSYRYTVMMPGNPNNGQKASVNYKLSTIGVNATVGLRL